MTPTEDQPTKEARNAEALRLVRQAISALRIAARALPDGDSRSWGGSPKTWISDSIEQLDDAAGMLVERIEADR